MDSEKITLSKTYLKAIPEAETIVKKCLNISCHNEDIRILTKNGALCFYGHWFGRPYDNYHKIIHTDYDGEILEIEFDRDERLLVYKPENITSTKRELKIAKAQKLKWLYIPYGSAARKYTAITYTAEGSRLLKDSKYGTERLTIKEPWFAVYIG